MSNRSSMGHHMDRHHLSSPSSTFVRKDSGPGTELNKKRKSQCQHTDLESPVSKQKLENQQVMELAESSENCMSYLVTGNVYTSPASVVSDWPCTSSSSCSNDATSPSTFCSSIEFDTGASTENSGSLGMDYNFKEELFKELEALHDPIITELVKNNMEACDADTDELGGTMQDVRATSTSRPLTIDQEFEQYFSKLML